MAFSFSFALTTLYLAYSAFCPIEELLQWNCQWCKLYGSNVKVQTVLNSNYTETYGYVAHTNDTIIIGFRGSVDLENWIENLNPETIAPFAQWPDLRLHKVF